MLHVAKLPSFADVLHRLSLGEAIEGSELLALPGFAEVETDYPMHHAVNYYLDQIPEVVVHAGRLAECVTPDAEKVGVIIAEEIAEHAKSHGYITDVIPDARAVLWQLGIDADIATKFHV